jgi:uncharacterized alkaline shock family protein YloU
MADLTKTAVKPKSLSKSEFGTNRNNENGASKSDNSASLLVGEDGTTIIHTEVVAKIAGMAVQEVPGVHELVPFDAGQSVTKLANRVLGNTMRDLGIHVEVGKTQAAVDVRIITEYGTSIVNISADIRKNVRTRIETMTGLVCVEVNIEVIDLFFPTDEADEAVDAPSNRVQ